MTIVEDARYDREEAHDALTRCTASLDTITDEESTSGKLSIERKLDEVKRKWDLFKDKSKILMDKQKVKTRDDPLYGPEKKIVDDAYKAMDIILDKAHNRLQLLEQLEAQAATALQTPKLKALVDDSKSRIKGRFDEIRTGVELITGVGELPKLNMYVGWLNAVEKILIHEALPAIDSWKASVTEDLREDIATNRSSYQEETLKTIRDLHVKIVEKRKEVAPDSNAGTAGVESSGSRPPTGGFGSMANMYTKIPLPRFDGQLRNYPMFRKRWRQGPGVRFSADDQMLHIIDQVPKTVEPRLKNAQTMVGVWKILDEEYNQPLDLVNEVTKDLVEFKVSNSKASDAAQFLELYDKYEQAKNDLEEAESEEELNSLALLSKIVQKFPKAISYEYGRYRVTVKESKEKEAVKFDAFMKAERDRQKEMVRFDPVVPAKPPTEPKKCSFCHKKGHSREECFQLKGKGGGSKVNHAGITQPQQKPCPLCNAQHTFKARGKTLYKSRLSACDTFRGKSVEERAKIVEDCGGCALCLLDRRPQTRSL